MSKIHLAPGATHTTETAVLYDNLLANGVLTASSGDGLNALGPQTFDYWTPSAMPATLAVALDDEAEADCVAIIGHTLGSDGATVFIEHSDDGVAWTVAATLLPTTDDDLLLIFPEAEADYWRVRVTGATEPSISVAMIGKRLIIPGGTLSGFVPLSSALEIDLQSQVTVGGQYRGSYIRKRGAGTSIPMAMQERDWVQTTGAAFIQHYNEGKPFVFMPCPDKLPDDAHYCWRAGDVLSGSLSVGSVHYDMSMQVSAYVG